MGVPDVLAKSCRQEAHPSSMASRSKFVIQPFKHNQQMDEDYAHRTWQTLHDAIQ